MVVVPGPSGMLLAVAGASAHMCSVYAPQEPARVVAEDGGEAPTQAEDQDLTSHTSTAHHGNGSGWKW